MAHYAVYGALDSELKKRFADGLHKKFNHTGYQLVEPQQDNIRLVFNFVDPKDPRPFRRKAQATYVVSVVETNEPPKDVLRTAYPILIRSLSNLLIFIVNQHSTGVAR